jgi:signal transduction histidine kinase
VEGLRAFGVYHRWGDALYRFGESPDTVTVEDADAPAQFTGGIVSFVRFVGGNPTDAGRLRRPFAQEGQSGPAAGRAGMSMGPGMGMGMGNSRYVFVSYDTAVLRRGERLVVLLAILVAGAIISAFLLLFSLVRSLEGYREREAKNRELLALGEAARTLTHEIKNPLGVIKIQTALLGKRAGEEARDGLRVIDEETDRLSLLASRVRAFLSADDGEPRAVSVSQCLASFASRYGDRLKVSRDDSAFSSRVLIDPLRLDQILDNLISNAAESAEGPNAEPPELHAETHRGEGPILGLGSGPGDPGERRRQGLRSFLHHQAQRSGHRPGPVQALRGSRPGRHRTSSQAGGRHGVRPRLA